VGVFAISIASFDLSTNSTAKLLAILKKTGVFFGWPTCEMRGINMDWFNTNYHSNLRVAACYSFVKTSCFSRK
jgi:hypothetical protein